MVSIAVVSIAVVFTVVAITVVYALEWRRVLPLVPLRSVLLPPVLTTDRAITALPAPVGCPYGYYYYAPYNRCVPTP